MGGRAQVRMESPSPDKAADSVGIKLDFGKMLAMLLRVMDAQGLLSIDLATIKSGFRSPPAHLSLENVVLGTFQPRNCGPGHVSPKKCGPGHVSA